MHTNRCHTHGLFIDGLIDCMQDSLWSNTQAGGDVCMYVWNERRTSHLPVTARDLQVASAWLQRLTSIFQAAQRPIFAVRRIELLSQDAQTRHATVVSQPRQRNPYRSLPSTRHGGSISYSSPQPPAGKDPSCTTGSSCTSHALAQRLQSCTVGGATCKKTGHYNHRPTESKQTYTTKQGT
jgi:hypothetical protein